MTSLVIIFVICTSQYSLTKDIFADERMKPLLERLCPKVDICNRNASEPLVNPNGALDARGYISCCTGCSCHKDCHENLNCCIPAETNSVSKENQNTSDDISTNDVDQNNSTNLNKSGLNVAENLPFGTIMSTRQCLYPSSGTPTEDWAQHEPAYRMVTRQPQGGCQSINSSELDKQQDSSASCSSEPIAFWGDMFPVYSEGHGILFKNVQCARCHGVYDSKSWTPMLVCGDKDLVTKRIISISEHFDFVRSDHLSKHCFVSFDFSDTAVLHENRCYTDTIMTCQQEFQVPYGVDLTQSELRIACHSGLYAPAVSNKNVYRNVFCAICNSDKIVKCESQYSIVRGRAKYNFEYLLDTSLILRNQKASEEVPKMVYPKACLHNGTTLVQESCRHVYCPSGQIRHLTGLCEFVSKRWYRGSLSLRVDLQYIDNNQTSILRMLNKGLVSHKNIFDNFKKKTPWPFYFKIRRLFHNTYAKTEGGAPFMVAVLTTDITRPDILVSTIHTSMNRHWNVVLGGVSLSFQQSFLPYDLTRLSGNRFKPRWRSFTVVRRNHIPNTASMILTTLAAANVGQKPYMIGKLVTCEHISLFEDEYTLMANKYILASNLTNRVLFDKEFELVEDESGKTVPRVCVQDTRFTLKSETNKASKPHSFALLVFLVPCLIYWALT